MNHARRTAAAVWTALGAAVLLAAPALAGGAEENAGGGGETGHAASPGLSVTGLLVVAAITVLVPVLFLVATALRAPGEGPEEELEPVVAGIPQGRSPVPRWLYAVYVVIPAWALVYLFNSAALAPPSPPEPTHAPTAAPATPAAGGPIVLVAKDLKFDKATITATAGQDVSIELRNQDAATLHNVSVYVDDSLEQAIFKGELFPGVATKAETFTAPAAGSYYFQCDVHPTTMTGTLVVS